MLFEQADQLLTPTVIDGGIRAANPFQSSFDACSFDDIYAYSPVEHPKTKGEYLALTDYNAHSGCNGAYDEQRHKELFDDLDFSSFADFDEKSQYINCLDMDDSEMEQLINQSALLSPRAIDQSTLFEDLCSTPTMEDLQNNKDPTSPLGTIPWVGGNLTIESPSAVMINPLSPSLSCSNSSLAPSVKRAGRKSDRSIAERKLRKKDQNKTAAEKYRLKKRAERERIRDRHAQLKTVNDDLKREVERMTFSVQQVKQLLTDLLQVPLPFSEITSE